MRMDPFFPLSVRSSFYKPAHSPTFGTKFERPFSSGNVQKYPVVRPTMREREEEREEGGSAWRKISRQFLLLEPTSEMRAAAWRMTGFLHFILSFVTNIALNFSLRLGRCHFLFSCDTVWAVFSAGSAAVLLEGTFTFHPRNAMELP